MYYENCALFLFRKKYSVVVVLPNKGEERIMQSIGLKSKNDRIDAKRTLRKSRLTQSLRYLEL